MAKKPTAAQMETLLSMRQAAIVLSNGEYKPNKHGGLWVKPRAATLAALKELGFLGDGMEITPAGRAALQSQNKSA